MSINEETDKNKNSSTPRFGTKKNKEKLTNLVSTMESVLNDEQTLNEAKVQLARNLAKQLKSNL